MPTGFKIQGLAQRGFLLVWNQYSPSKGIDRWTSNAQLNLYNKPSAEYQRFVGEGNRREYSIPNVQSSTKRNMRGTNVLYFVSLQCNVNRDSSLPSFSRQAAQYYTSCFLCIPSVSPSALPGIHTIIRSYRNLGFRLGRRPESRPVQPLSPKPSSLGLPYALSDALKRSACYTTRGRVIRVCTK